MEEESSWISYSLDDPIGDVEDCDTVSELGDEENKEVIEVSMDLVLPDDLLERILAYLPIVSIFKAGSVCKRWQEIVCSRSFLRNLSCGVSHKPWYFMFTTCAESIGYHAYDPILRTWYNIPLPNIKPWRWLVASSCGLVCFMDNDSRSELLVCNLITKCCKRLKEPPGVKFPSYSTFAMSVNRISHNYNVSVVKCNQILGNFFECDLSILLYDSDTMMWMTVHTQVLNGWRGGDESVICDGVLYFLVYPIGRPNPLGLIAYNLFSRRSPHEYFLTENRIQMPCSLASGRLMNLKGKLVMVGGIAEQNQPEIIKGIGIWVLNGKEWQEIARMPDKLFLVFEEMDDVFASGGSDDLIYIQSYGGPALLVFDMNQNQWKWSKNCRCFAWVRQRFPIDVFGGFCYEPRLDINP